MCLNNKIKKCLYLLESAICKLDDIGYNNYISCSEYEEIDKTNISKLDEKELTKILNNLKKKFKNYKSNLETCTTKVSDIYGNTNFEDEHYISSN